MALSLSATILILAAAFGVFGFALWRARVPADPLRVRLIDYHVVQLVALVVALLMLAHLVTLIAGHPLTGRGL